MKKIKYTTDQNNPAVKEYVAAMKKAQRAQPPFHKARSYFDLSKDEQKQTVLKAAKESSKIQRELLEKAAKQSSQAETPNRWLKKYLKSDQEIAVSFDNGKEAVAYVDQMISAESWAEEFDNEIWNKYDLGLEFRSSLREIVKDFIRKTRQDAKIDATIELLTQLKQEWDECKPNGTKALDRFLSKYKDQLTSIPSQPDPSKVCLHEDVATAQGGYVCEQCGKYFEFRPPDSKEETKKPS